VAETLAVIKQCEDQIEAALQSLEMAGELGQALRIYRAVEARLDAIDEAQEHAAHTEKQRVLAYCLMRQGNILRQTGDLQEARELGEREMAAARKAADELTLARSLMSNGTNLLASGEIERGLGLVEESRSLFEKGEGYDCKQGLGWYWILRADLGNAGLVGEQPTEVVDAAEQALEVLLPLENWSGVARAYAARAVAYERMGEHAAAAADRKAQQHYQSKVASEKDSNG
jgi:tetratricopeptide (TPR) repeat protein